MKLPKARADDYKVLSKLAYRKHADRIKKDLPPGYRFDQGLSTRETKVFYNPSTKKVVIAYRGTDLRDGHTLLKDLHSDLNIAVGQESQDPRFQQAVKEFERIYKYYHAVGYSVDTTGHSLGGSLATYVNKRKKGKVDENLSFSRGSGVMEPFRKRPTNTYDYSHQNDLISLGARLSRDQDGSHQQSMVSKTHTSGLTGAHDIDRLDTFQHGIRPVTHNVPHPTDPHLQIM
jgi:hypothetical protein